MKSIELTEEEIGGLIDIIDGTLDSMLQDVDLDHPDTLFWFEILRKLGEAGEQLVERWTNAD